MIRNVSSKDNKVLKLARLLKKKNGRTDNHQFIVEGKKMILEAAVYVPDDIKYVIVSSDFFEKEHELIADIEKSCSDIYVVPTNVFNEISDTDTPQGVLAILDIPKRCFSVDEKCQGIVVLDCVSEPGNMGTIIRTAEALGFDGVYLMKGCTDIYAPKTVRATMGSLFRMRFKEGCSVSEIEDLKNKGFSIIATTPNGDTVLEDYDSPKRCAVIIGNEAHGVCDALLAIADVKIKIKMDGLAESLNAAVAAGIVMHWLKK